MNIGEVRERVYQELVNATATAHNTHAVDGQFADGTTYEFKTLIGSKPSLGGKKTLDGCKTIEEAIKKYLIADWLIVEDAENHYLKMNNAEAVEWLMERVTLSRASEKRGGWYKLRILKNPRSEESTRTILKAGYQIR